MELELFSSQIILGVLKKPKNRRLPLVCVECLNEINIDVKKEELLIEKYNKVIINKTKARLVVKTKI